MACSIDPGRSHFTLNWRGLVVPSAGLSTGVWEPGQEALRAGDIGAQIGPPGLSPSGEDLLSL